MGRCVCWPTVSICGCSEKATSVMRTKLSVRRWRTATAVGDLAAENVCLFCMRVSNSNPQILTKFFFFKRGFFLLFSWLCDGCFLVFRCGPDLSWQVVAPKKSAPSRTVLLRKLPKAEKAYHLSGISGGLASEPVLRRERSASVSQCHVFLSP